MLEGILNNALQDDREPLGTSALRYVQVNPGRDALRTTESGPAAGSWVNNECGPLCVGTQGIHQIGNAAAYSNTFEYAQCIFLDQAGIPTLGEWGLISLGLILLIIGAFYLRRRKARA
ncbi:MAG: IPTL-CTERM sorting domain-containing protein [Candidatus Dadabacteria bacterium]|nr:IPTL-CTERM sorting domain-containing protein [Candidatus Dadabacteria bacterium]